MSAFSKGPTLDQLHRTWMRRNKKGPLWPATFEEAMENPLLSRILKIEALHIEIKAMVKREGPQQPEANSSPGTISRLQHRGLDRRAYWMDSVDPDDEST